MKHERFSPATYSYRTEHCSECGGSGVRMGASYNDITCHDCSGEGEWETTCADCGEANPLNDCGVCEQCSVLVEVEQLPGGGILA